MIVQIKKFHHPGFRTSEGTKVAIWACICLECSLNIKGKSTTIIYNERFLKHSGISMTSCIPQCSVSPAQEHLV